MPKKKIAKPNQQEKRRIKSALKKKYPDMANKTGAWVEGFKKKVKKELKTERTKNIEAQLRKSGMSDDEIRRLRGK